MEIVDKKNLQCIFNKKLYNSSSYFFVTSDVFWDGGIDPRTSLKDKSEFYILAATMSDVFKKIVSILNEEIYVADIFCENEKMYAQWSDLKKIELFRIISKTFKRGKCYKLSLLEDSEMIDLIIESNFKYYTHFSFFLPNSGTIIQPTCHTELIVYSENLEYISDILKNILKVYDNIYIKHRGNT